MTTTTPAPLPVGGYVFDEGDLLDIPPFALLHESRPGVVVLHVQPTPGESVYVTVPVGEPVPLPGCEGWAAVCTSTAAPRFPHDYCAVVWLTCRGERRAMPPWEGYNSPF